MDREALVARFWAFARAPDALTGCRLWLGSQTNGHARFHLLRDERAPFENRRDVSAHLVAWWLTHGTFGKFIDRTCGDTRCVEPAHLAVRTKAARFWQKVDRKSTPDGCWPWKGGRHTFGYGSTTNGAAHRVAYELTYGPIPAGAVVRHTCINNPICCRPEHLVIGTQLDNVHDAIAAGRMRYTRGERAPLSKFSAEQAAAIREVFTAMRTTGSPRNKLLDMLARALDVNSRTVWRVVTNRSYQTEVPNEDDAAPQLLKTLRANGFPWEHIAEVEEDPIARVRAAKVTIEGDTIKSVGHSGQATCLRVHPHRFAAKHQGQRSVLEAFNDDQTLLRAVRYQARRGDPTTPTGVVRALQAFVRAPRNFPPALARWLVDEYAPLNGTVLDPCSGYGGRLLGALASHKNVHYVGFDVEPASVEGNRTLAAQVGRSIVQEQRAVEDTTAPWPTADLVLAGPPYFDLEKYGAVADMNLRRYSSYSDWRDGFLRTLIARSLNTAPVLALNVARVGTRDLPGDAAAISAQLGARVDRTLTWPLRRFGRHGREEKILIIRRG